MTQIAFIQAIDIIGILSSTWPLLLILVVFYFFIIRPQNKRQKEQDNFLDNLEKGDEVATNSGMIGRINKIEDHIITLQVDTKTFIKVLKSSLSKEMTDNINGEE